MPSAPPAPEHPKAAFERLLDQAFMLKMTVEEEHYQETLRIARLRLNEGA